MKLPFEFGIKLIFRLVVPGFIVTIGLLPALNAVLKPNGWSDKAEYVFIISVILFGWIITISDMSIYMLLEGRRFWPEKLKTRCVKREKERLRKIEARTTDPDAAVRKEAFFDLRNFGQDADGDYEATWPSRLGNLLAASEGYAGRIYGIDSVFYWYRIWLKLDKDVREEVDNSQALADSTTYTSFALSISGILWLLYPIIRIIAGLLIWLNFLGARVNYDLMLANQFLPRKAPAVLIALSFLLASYVLYRGSLRLHAQYGEFFKSIFDVNVESLEMSPVIVELSSLTADSPVVCLNRNLGKKDQLQIAARYLQYYRYRCPACNDLLKPNQINLHVCPVTNHGRFGVTVHALR